MARDEVNIYTTDETVADHSTDAAPSAAGAVATIAAGSLPAGIYDVECYVAATGTVAAATETDNFDFRKGGTVVAVLPIIITGTTASSEYSGPYTFRVELDGSTALTVNAVANSTASSVYHALVKATRLSLTPVVL